VKSPAFVLAALCLAGSAAQAQTSLLSYYQAPAGASESCAAQDQAGNLFVVYSSTNSIPNITIYAYAVSVLKFDLGFHNTATITTTVPFSPVAAAVDANGALWLAGSHTLVKLTASGPPALSMELGGADPHGSTSATAIAIDASGNVYVIGTTSQSDFPVSAGAFQGFPSGSIPFALQQFYAFGFVSKFSNSGTRLLSTLVRGVAVTLPVNSTSAAAFAVTTPAAIAVDASGAVTIAGTTNTVDYPVTAGAPQSVCKCRAESGNIFLTRLAADFKSLIWSTFLGGTAPQANSMTEQVSGLALDPDGGAVVAGTTWDPDFPVTPGAFEPALPAQAGTGPHGFVTRLNASGTAWLFSTYLAGSQEDFIGGIQADTKGNLWVAGGTGSPDFPMLPGSLQLGSALVLELAADGSRLLASERIPGAEQDSYAVSGRGDIWINPDGTLTISGGAVLTVASGTNTVSGWLLRLPAAPVSGVSLMGVADSAASQTGGTVAPGEFMSLYGTGLGPASGAGAALDSTDRIASQLAGTQVLFDGRAAPLLWASATQINVLAPYEILGQTKTTLQVVTSAGTSQTLDLTVVPTQPNVLAIVNADGTVNGPNHPAVPGSILTMYVSGAGTLMPSLPDGSIAPNPAPSPISVVSITNLGVGSLVGECPDLTQQVLYAGSSPGLVMNALQVNFLYQPPPGTSCYYSAPQLTIGDAVVSLEID